MCALYQKPTRPGKRIFLQRIYLKDYQLLKFMYHFVVKVSSQLKFRAIW